MPKDEPGSAPIPDQRLNGWKEIANYIGKTARTAQRWEEEFDLPVHRIGNENHEIIFTFRSEIDEWQISTERLRFETLLADVSARFINLPPSEVDKEIGDSLHAFCECFGVDHATFWQFSIENPKQLILTHTVRDSQLQPIPFRTTASEFAPWSYQKIMRNEIVCVPDTANPPLEVDTKSKDKWRQVGVKSVLALPLSAGGCAPIGAVGFASTRKPRNWPEKLQKRMRLITEIFANALDRKRADQKLKESELSLKLASEAARVALWTLDPTTGKMWTSEISTSLAGLAPGQQLDFERILGLVHPEDRDVISQNVANAMATGEAVTIEYRLIRPDGSIHRMMSRGCRHSYNPEGPYLLMGVTMELK